VTFALAVLCLWAAATAQPAAGTAAAAVPTGQAAAPAQPPDAEPFAIDLRAEPEEITLGDHVTVKLAVEHDARDVYSLPGYDPSPMTVPQGAPPPQTFRQELPQGKARTTFTLVLADVASLEPRLADFKLRVTGPDGDRALTVRGRLLKFKSLLQKEDQGAPDRAHHGPKPPVAVMVRSYLWVLVLAGVALLALLLIAFRIWQRREKAVLAEAIVEVPFDERALAAIARLRQQKPWARGAGRAAIFELSEVVRGYLGERLAFNGLDLTSEELIGELKSRRLMGLDLAALAEEVQWEDLVKFAKLEPTAEECVRALDRAESIVRHTRPLAPAPPKEAAA
jgi:hypothetical protein